MKIRGFEVAKGFEGDNIKLPKRSTARSAGYDLEASEETIIKANDITIVNTGLKAYMLEDEVLELYIRSSYGIKHNLTLANQVGIIDSDYYNNPSNDGHIMVAIRSFRDNDMIINKGERIAQGVFLKYLSVDNDIPSSKERIGGIGSSDL
jgi:dUTP pyrophosphatase